VPPLLRTYLMMGGWIGDHAVIDPHMKTTHVFTALRVADVPEAHKRLADSWT
jgi:putative hemolysin